LAQILRQRAAGGAARIADKADAGVRTNAQRSEEPGAHLAIAEDVAPARGVERVEPAAGAPAPGGGLQVHPRLPGLGRDPRIWRLARQAEPANRLLVLAQEVEGPAQLEHDVEIGRIGF